MRGQKSNQSDWSDYGFTTRAVHAGQEADPLTGGVTVPIYETSTFAQESPGRSKGYEYSRTANPTRAALETSIASIEKARHGLAFSSGMGAISTLGAVLKTGDRVLICDDVYGGTFRLFTKVFQKFGVGVDFVDATNLDSLERHLKKKSYSFLLIESPTNPLMKIIDIEKCSGISHEYGSRVIADNTFSSPYLSNPLQMGADIVVHSTTKYLGGHSDVVGGAIVVNDEETYEKLKFLQNAIGAVPSPFDCWLVLRGIRTLSLRMERHCENAMSISEQLDAFRRKGEKIQSVNYPGLPDNSYHILASKQMKNYGGMLSFVMNSKRVAVSFLEHLKLFATAESLGGVESLAEIPSIMTHASIPRRERIEKGITDSLVRISSGIEDKEDLAEDIAKALKSA